MRAEWDIFDNRLQLEAEPLSLQDCLNAGAQGVSISNEQYHALPGLSGSSLKWLAESNRHYDNRHLFNTESPSLNFGSLVHTLVLEPHDVFSRYVIQPKADLRTTAGKALVAEFNANAGTKTVVTADDYQRADKMARNVRAIAGDIIDQGIKERSLFCEYEGLILKARLDIDIEKTGDDYDLKTITLGTKDFSDQTLERHIKKYGYHLAAALRNIVRRQLGKPVGKTCLIFVDTANGHQVRTIQIDPDWIEHAEYQVKELLLDRQFYLARHIDKPITVIRTNYYD